MKKILLVLLPLILVSCGQKPIEQPTTIVVPREDTAILTGSVETVEMATPTGSLAGTASTN